MIKTIVLTLGALLGVFLLILSVAWLFLRGPDIPFDALRSKYEKPEDHFLALENQVVLHYRDQGQANKPVLLLLHGYGDSYATWEPWAEQLKQEFRVISLDLPGHGLTQSPADYQIGTTAFADLVNSVALALKLPPFAVVGNSMGGAVAWQLAVRHPERLNALVLLDAAGQPVTDLAQSPSLAFRILQHPLGRWVLERIDNRPLIEQGLKAQVFNPQVITPTFVDRWAEYQRIPGHRTVLMSARPGAHAMADAEDLARLKLPTLVIHGAADTLIPIASSRLFAQQIPGACLLVYPDAGHLPQWEIPQKSARDVADFLMKRPLQTPFSS